MSNTPTKEGPRAWTSNAKLIPAQTITAPEFRGEPDSRVYLLGFVDKSGNQQHYPVDRDLYVYAAGRNLEGHKPDGLDMLTAHAFHVYVSHKPKDRAVALDIIPIRMLRSGFAYVRQKDVEHITIRRQVSDKVLRCEPMERPSGMLASAMRTLFVSIRKAIVDGKLAPDYVIPNVGTIVSVDDAKIIVAPHVAASEARPVYGAV